MTPAPSVWELAAQHFDAPKARFATPLDLGVKLDPRTVRTPALDLINEELVKTMNTPDGRLIISMSPQEGKSQTGSRRFPEWALMQNPNLRIAIASYEANIARRWGRAIRDDIQTHPETFNLSVRDDLSAQHEWQLAGHEGGVFTAGVGGAMTGRPVDCIAGDVYIECEHGKLQASEAFKRNIKWLRAYDENSGRAVWRRVEASRRISGRPVVEVATEAGRVLTCTSDHRVYTSRGYVPAGSLRRGETLLGIVGDGPMPVRPDMAGAEDGCPQDDPQMPAPVLLTRVHGDGDREHPEDSNLRRMRRAGETERRGNLLTRLPSEVPGAESYREGLPAVWAHVPTEGQSHSVLLPGLRESGARAENDRTRQLSLQDRDELCEVVPLHAATDPAAGRREMRGLFGDSRDRIRPQREASAEVWARHSPLEREALGQHGGELDHAVLHLSRGAPQVERDAVSVVRGVGGEGVDVYDFQVEGTRNFFAGGVLVHNCLIIDDPVKGREQADSPTIQEKTWSWWTDTALTRLAPGAPVVLILTRWHEKDLAGRLLETEPDIWRFVNIPAEAIHRPELGETDILGREPGEFMISARGRTKEQWEARKKSSGPATWSALYLGKPAPAEGGIFPRDWPTYDTPMWTENVNGARTVPGVGARVDHELIQSWDLSVKDTGTADFTVGQVWLRIGGQAYLLDQVRERMGFDRQVQAIEAMTAKWPQAAAKFVEDKANGPAVINHLRRRIPGLIPVNPEGGKVTRAHAVSPFVHAKNVHLPVAALLPNVQDLRSEALNFPHSAHDDTIDALTQALNQLLLNPITGHGNPLDEVDPGDWRDDY